MKTEVVVENRPGAGGAIATAAVAKTPPDGYTLLLGTGGTMTLNPIFYSNLPYDSAKDFLGIAMVASTPLYMAVKADSPYRNVDDLVAAAKAKPGELAYGTIGNGSTPAIASALFAKAKGIQLTDVPYAGYAPGLNEILAGRLAFMFLDGTSLARFEQGSLRALAVSTGHRARRLPNVPTLKELGVDADLAVWFGIYTRSGVPAEVAQRLRQEVRSAIESPSFRKEVGTFGMEPGTLFGEEFQKFHLDELKRWERTIPTLGLKAPT